MSPEQINEEVGHAAWKCWHCKAETGLWWWNGLSVAVCHSKPECGKAYSDFLKDEVEREEAFQRYCDEHCPW